MDKPSLETRRRELVERCAEQRTALADDVQALRPANLRAELLPDPLAHPVVASMLAHRNWILGGGAVALGLLAFRRKKVLALAGGVLSNWRTVSGVMAVLSRLRG